MTTEATASTSATQTQPAAPAASTSQAAASPIQQTQASATTAQTAAVTAQAPAAVSPATPNKEATTSEVPAVFGEPTTYQSTGNSNLDTALKFAGSLGLDVETSLEMQQATKGNFGPLRALLAAKQIPGSEAYIALAEAGYKEAVAAKQEKDSAVQGIVVAAAGGEQQWAEVFNWASEHADQDEKDQINAAFEQGGFVAEAVAALLVKNYGMQPGVSMPAQASPVKPTAGAQTAPGSSGPLSPMAYSQAVADLRRSLNGRQIEGSPEYAVLQRRRQAFR